MGELSITFKKIIDSSTEFTNSASTKSLSYFRWPDHLTEWFGAANVKWVGIESSLAVNIAVNQKKYTLAATYTNV